MSILGSIMSAIFGTKAQAGEGTPTAGGVDVAAVLNYTGNTNDSASMNIWLHQQVMQKLAANGGKVPADLLKY